MAKIWKPAEELNHFLLPRSPYLQVKSKPYLNAGIFGQIL